MIRFPGPPLADETRKAVAWKCAPAYFIGIGSMAAWYGSVSLAFALGSVGLLSVVSMILLLAVGAAFVALPALALSILFVFYFAGYVHTRPLMLAVCATAFGLLPSLFFGEFLKFLLIASPGLVVSAVKLTRAFDRIAQEIDEEKS